MSGMLRALENPFKRRSSHSHNLCSHLGSLRLQRLDQQALAWLALHGMSCDERYYFYSGACAFS